MKTIIPLRSCASAATAPNRYNFIDNVLIHSIALILAIVTMNCHRPVDPVKETGGVGMNPSDSTITKPGNSTSTDGPIGVFKRLKISWAPTDFQEVQFDADNRPVQYISQALYNQGTGDVQRHVYQFLYQPNGDVYQVTLDGKGYLSYLYEHNRISRIEEYTAKQQLVVVRSYQYSATNQLIQVDEHYIADKKETRKTYDYDARSNLHHVTEFTKSPATGAYVLEMTTTYDDYDDGKHVENLLAEYPFLPGITFRANNYRRKVVRYKDGTELSQVRYQYQYNSQGYPVQQTVSEYPNSRTATYTY